MVVDSPSKIASVAQNTVWMGVDGDDAMAGECAFSILQKSFSLRRSDIFVHGMRVCRTSIISS